MAERPQLAAQQVWKQLPGSGWEQRTLIDSRHCTQRSYLVPRSLFFFLQNEYF
jgi:hypothetical protein